MPANLPYPSPDTPITAMEQYVTSYSYIQVHAVAHYPPFEASATPATEALWVGTTLPIVRALKLKLVGPLGWTFADAQVTALSAGHVRVSTCATPAGTISSTVTQRVEQGPAGMTGPTSMDLVDQGGHWLVYNDSDPKVLTCG